MNSEININNDLYDRKMVKQLVQQLSIAIATKRSILDYLLVEFLTPINVREAGDG